MNERHFEKPSGKGEMHKNLTKGEIKKEREGGREGEREGEREVLGMFGPAM